LSHGLSEGVTLAANAGTGFRAPTIFEMFANGVHGGVAAFQRGNPELDPERSFSGDVAVRLRTERVRGEVSVWGQRVLDYIYLANTGESTGDGLPILAADQTDATLTGAEGQVEVDVSGVLAVGGSFAVLAGTGDGLEDPAFDNPDGALPLLPENRVRGWAELRAPGTGVLRGSTLRFSVGHFLARDSGGRIEPFSQFDNIPFGTASTEAYTLLSLEGRTTMEVGRVPVSLRLSVENLTDEIYRGFLDTYKGYALSPGQNIQVRLSAPLSFNR
jgi:iron complex outermembrane receptor protein/hemoglobin/transferrin/lactoferrin receptor protein